MSKYVHLYDINLDHSWVAVEDNKIKGLGLLGIRQRRAWITRLGVLPECRCGGIGGLIIDKLCHSAVESGATEVWLEMIVGNTAARKLFTRKGFVIKETLIVANRSSNLPEDKGTGIRSPQVASIDKDLILRLLERRTGQINWRVDSETYRKLPGLRGYSIDLADGSRGWICWRRTIGLP